MHDVFLIMIRSEQCKNKCATLSCEPNNHLNIIVCTISVTEGEVAGLKLVQAPPLVIHYWPFQGGGYDVVSVVYNTFSAIWVAEWPPLWKLLPARLAI